MPQDHQQEDLKTWNRFTYSLRAGKCHKAISKRTFNCKTGSLTPWGQENATRPSERGPATVKQVCLLPESRNMPSINKRTCSYKTGSLTYWERENGTRWLARGPAAMKLVHLQTEIRKCHKTISKRTCSYEMCSLTLWTGTHAMINQRISSYISHNYLHSGIRKMPMTLSKWSYNYCSRPPTSYR